MPGTISDNDYMSVVKLYYPEFTEEGWHVEMAAMELEGLKGGKIARWRPPKNWIFVRLIKPGEIPRLLIIPNHEYKEHKDE